MSKSTEKGYTQLKPRCRTRKTDQNESYTRENVIAAVKLVIEENYSQRAAAIEKNVPQKTLNR